VIELSIILVNYKSERLLSDCLRSLYAQTREGYFEVLVVDNHSGDDSKDNILREFPMVNWIEMDYNSGFARANNEGIRQSNGSVVLLLNADTLIEHNAIDNCYLQFKDSGYIACGVQLLNADRSPQISGNYFMKGGLNYLLPLPYLGNFFKGIGEFAGIKKPNVPDATGTVEVDWINGAFLMVKKSAIEKAGLLDEDFFLYSEEAEWCYRLQKQGRLCIYGNIKVIHLQGEITNRIFQSKGKGYYNLFDRKGRQIMVSVFVRIRKQFGVGWFFVNLLWYVADIPVFFAGLVLSKIIYGSRSAYSFLDFRNFCGNMLAILNLVPVIVRNKPHFYKVL
jgi:GT2 family glycosyltransferase